MSEEWKVPAKIEITPEKGNKVKITNTKGKSLLLSVMELKLLNNVFPELMKNVEKNEKDFIMIMQERTRKP